MNNNRIAVWDNAKFFMMMCVVIGHALYFFNSSSSISRGIYLFLYTFSMPVFVFITGVFSQHTVKNRKYECVLGYLFIYIVIKFLETLGDYIAKGKLEFHFLWEAGPAWYALVIAVFLVVTIMIQDYNPKVILCAALFIGCVAGLDTHFGDHYASMRICVFYPVFLAGHYLGGELLLNRETPTRFFKGSLIRILSLTIMVALAYACIKYSEVLYPYINFIKGKTAYVKLSIGIEGVIFRLINYALWGVVVVAVLQICPRGNYFWSWLGRRTLSTYVWHYFVITLLVYPLSGRTLIMSQCPTYYIGAVIVIACIITIVTAYLPSFDIRKHLITQKWVGKH